MTAQMTRHSVKRGRERLGIKKSACEKAAQRALVNGVTHADTKGGLNRYLTALYFDKGTANNIRVYNRFVYLFEGERLITILPLPKKYVATADKLQRSKAV